jgi:hypothetical protein
MILDRAKILALDDRKFESVKVPEWKGEVRIRSLTARERDQFEISMMDDPKRGKDVRLQLENMRAKFVSLIVCDEDGKVLFTEADVEALGDKNGKALSRLFDAGQKLSGMTAEDLEEKREKMASDPI